MSFVCAFPECSYVGESKQLLSRHRRRVHSEQRTSWACEHKGCEASFTNRDNLARHCRNLHGTERWSCTECTEKFANALVYRVHCRTSHSMEPRFLCELCGVFLGSATHFVTHRMSVHGKGGSAHPCEFCAVIFQSKWHLRRHKCRALSEKGSKEGGKGVEETV